MLLLATWALGLLAGPLPRPELELELGPDELRWLVERAPALLLVEAPALSTPPRWEEAQTWRLWSEALGALAAAGDAGLEASRRRAALAELALAQGRSEDAWRHLARARELPDAELAGALARLVLGAVGDDGKPALPPFGPFPDGVLLAPAPPPAQPDPARARLERRELRLVGFAVGGARLALRVALEAEGVQVDLEHLEGLPARARVRVPVPEELEPLELLVDWQEQEPSELEVLLELSAESPRRTLWLRCRPRPLLGPTALPVRVPAALRSGGLSLAAASLEPAPLGAVAAALAERTELVVRALPSGTSPAAAAPEPAGLGLVLAPGAEGRRELARLVHLVEAWVLGERP